MSDESVDEERMVGMEPGPRSGRQDKDVMPNSCPTSKASKVTENCFELAKDPMNTLSLLNPPCTYLPSDNLAVKIWRFREICFPPSPSATSPRDISNASSNSSFSSPLVSSVALFTGSMFHKRMVASWEPEASINGSSCIGGGLKDNARTQSS